MDTLLGYGSEFPAPYEGAPRYYWRSWLQNELVQIDPLFAYTADRRKAMQEAWLESARRLVRGEPVA